jgi:hypothetical protein
MEPIPDDSDEVNTELGHELSQEQTHTSPIKFGELSHRESAGKAKAVIFATPTAVASGFPSVGKLQIPHVSQQYDQFVLTINYRCGRQMVCSGNTQVLQIV